MKPSSSENNGESSLLIDPRDEQRYKTVEINGKIWMAENLNYEITHSWYYDNDPKNEKEYARLYTWEAAKKACPPDWRLPKDDEWQGLMDYYRNDKAAYKQLIKGGRSGFNALLGGWRFLDGDYYGLGSYGYYWSSTEGGLGHAWYYSFNSNYSKLGRYHFLKPSGRSCRCLKDWQLRLPIIKYYEIGR